MRSFDARGRSSERSTRLDGSGGERWTAIIESSRESCNRRRERGKGDRLLWNRGPVLEVFNLFA